MPWIIYVGYGEERPQPLVTTRSWTRAEQLVKRLRVMMLAGKRPVRVFARLEKPWSQ